MPSVDPKQTLAEMVRQNPGRARVFERHNLDFCCGGGKSLAEACTEHELDVDTVRAELEEVDARSDSDEEIDFEDLTELVDFIVDHHHAYLREELGPLGGLVEKVANRHGDAHPELEGLEETFEELSRELPVHLAEEEQLVFPAVRQLDQQEASDTALATAEAALDGLVDDHDETAEHLDRLRELTDDYSVPPDACPSYENMLERLERLERNVHLHVHRENHILFEHLRERLG